MFLSMTHLIKSGFDYIDSFYLIVYEKGKDTYLYFAYLILFSLDLKCIIFVTKLVY